PAGRPAGAADLHRAAHDRDLGPASAARAVPPGLARGRSSRGAERLPAHPGLRLADGRGSQRGAAREHVGLLRASDRPGPGRGRPCRRRSRRSAADAGRAHGRPDVRGRAGAQGRLRHRRGRHRSAEAAPWRARPGRHRGRAESGRPHPARAGDAQLADPRARGGARVAVSRKDTAMLSALVLSSDSHVFEPPDLWSTRIDRAFRDRAPRMERIDGADQIVIEKDQILSGIGLISNAGARFEAPETISAQGRFEDVHRGGYDPEQHLKDMVLDGVSGEVLYPSQGLFYFKVADTALMSAIFRAYNDWLAEFCRTDPARLKGIAMVNLDDVQAGIAELERAARLGLAGAMITEYPLEDRRYDQPEYEPFWAAAASLGLPLSLHTATRRQGKIRGFGEKTLRDTSSRSTKAHYPALSMCDMILSGVFERHPRLMLAIVEFELAWAPHVVAAMDYTYRERHEEAIYRFKDAMVPSDFF